MCISRDSDLMLGRIGSPVLVARWSVKMSAYHKSVAFQSAFLLLHDQDSYSGLCIGVRRDDLTKSNITTKLTTGNSLSIDFR